MIFKNVWMRSKFATPFPFERKGRRGEGYTKNPVVQKCKILFALSPDNHLLED